MEAKKLTTYRTCPLCGGDNLRTTDRDNALTSTQYEAACAALKLAGLTPADGHTDESFNESVKAGDIDPKSVCITCCTDEDGNLLE